MKKVTKHIIVASIAIYLFLLSIKLMSSSFKLFGSGFAEQLLSFTTSPFVGLFIGILATSLVQSSSATTSIVVGLTASGALSIAGAIPIIMGANIGTSITNTIVSLGHVKNREEFRKAMEVGTIHDFFNILAVIVLLPIELLFHPLEKMAIWLTSLFVGSASTVTLANPLDVILKPMVNWIKHLLNDSAIILLILALGMLFFSLRLFVKTIKPLASTKAKEILDKHIFSSPIRSFAFGAILTITVQSSSVTTSLIVPMAGIGLITLESVFPYILGANLGTTITSLLAALATGSAAALSVSFSHILFNAFGSVLIYPIKKIPLFLATSLGSLSYRSKVYPIAYIATMYYAMPSLIIFLLYGL